MPAGSVMDVIVLVHLDVVPLVLFHTALDCPRDVIVQLAQRETLLKFHVAMNQIMQVIIDLCALTDMRALLR